MTQDPFGPGSESDAELRKELDERLGCSDPGDEALLARVKARVMRSIQAETGAQHRTVRAEEGLWRNIGPGVERKLLWVSGGMESWMVRLAPGAMVGGHLHPTDEECVVLEGSLRIGTDLLLRQGDFHVAASGSSHESVTTETGALLYLRGAPKEDVPV